ncbi:MAG: nucleoside kinase [Candidatus Marinimicrobia bacterium]|nr:nucleoside kinase [Candidatus Neomarinimicrobiota bacterium]
MSRLKITLNNKNVIFEKPKEKIYTILKKNLKDDEYLPFVVVKNHKLCSLNDIIREDSIINTFPEFHESSKRTYLNTAVLILSHICNRKFHDLHLTVLHSMADGVYCKFLNHKITDELVSQLKEEFQQCIESALPIEPVLYEKIAAINYFKSVDRLDTTKMLQYCSQNFLILYELEGSKYWEQAPLAPNTNLIKVFDIMPYSDGFILRCPVEGDLHHLQEFANQEKLYEVFQEFVRWGEILKLVNISDINEHIVNHTIPEVIKISESLQDKKMSYIADQIKETGKRLVFIAGPSSSGKTTFANKLAIQLKVLGLNALTLSLDDYFKDRDELKREQGENLDFEVLEAIDLKLLNQHLKLLLNGHEIAMPRYNFLTGKKEDSGRKLKVDKKTILLFEGIHGINPGLTQEIDDNLKFKIYISALTHLNFDEKNRIATHDMRLLRRIVRDFKYRGYSAADTIAMWKKVVEGEKKYIFKFQQFSDIMFNSALVYEMNALKNDAEKVLMQVPFEHPSYPEAERLLDILSFFLPIDGEHIPDTSLIREFLGGSAFQQGCPK